MPTLHQFVSTLEPGATGGHAVEIQRLLRSQGWHSELFWHDAKPPFDTLGHDYRTYGSRIAAEPDDLLLYHVAIGSVIADWLVERSERLLLYFHNLTPAAYYDRWEPFAAYACTWGRTQLRQLAGRTTLAMAASEFSQRELLEVGYLDTAVVPILLDTAQFHSKVDSATLERLEKERAGGGTRWLFVGRLSPNKTQEDIIKAFWLYRRVYDPDARLALLGGPARSTYGAALQRYVEELDLGGAVDLTGGVAEGVKVAYLRTADVFVYLSEHEGFGVPILEAWHHDVPVVGFDAGAIAEVAGDAALILSDKSAPAVAAAVQRVQTDTDLRDRLIARSRQRRQVFSLEQAQARFLDAVARVRPRS